MPKLLTVFGATGQQGGAVIQHVLENPALSSVFKVRGVSRDTTKPASAALIEKGVEMVEADLDDPTSLSKAVDGAYTVFAVTNYWEKAVPAIEIAQGKAIADACVAAGVNQIIWSSLPSPKKLTNGRVTAVKYFDSKAVVEDYIRTLPIQATFYWAGMYMQNHLHMMKPVTLGDGTWEYQQPLPASTIIPLIDIRDSGKYIARALLDPAAYHHKVLAAATKYYTMAEMAEGWTRVTGKHVTFRQIGGEDMIADGMTEEQKDAARSGVLGSLAELKYFGPTGEADVKWTLDQVDGKLTTWEEFVKDHEPWF